MPVSPGLAATLATDFARGVWSPATHQFWEQRLLATGTLRPTPGLLVTLQQDLARGIWSPITLQTLRIVLAPTSPSLFTSLAREWCTGQFGPVSRQVLQRL